MSTEEKKETKVFEFAKEGYSYTVKSSTKEKARKFLFYEHNIDIQNCFEVPESEWDKPTAFVYQLNDSTKQPYYISLREIFSGAETELLCTTDCAIID